MKSFRILPAIAFALLLGCSSAKTQSGSPSSQTSGSSGNGQSPEMGMNKSASSTLSYNHVNVDQPVIALTFDDGPSAKLTPELLDILKERNIKVTFFVLGEMVQQNPDILRRAAAEGHEIGNHTWDHKQLTHLSPEAVSDELNKTSDIIKETIGKKPTLMRPPYGSAGESLKKRINEEFGMKVILWEVDPMDWKDPGPAVVTSRIVSNTHPGYIILSHDIHAGTVKAMPDILDQLKAKGFRFVTVSELLAMDKGPAPKPAAGAKASPAAAQGAASTGTPTVVTAPARQ